MIELHKIIRLAHVVACVIIYILFYGRGWQRGVFKIKMNDHFLVFFFRFGGLFPNLY